MLFRLILLLAIAGTMTLFTLQNLSPVLPLVFLGSPTLALPLSWWILGAIAAGALTTIAITFLVGLSNFLTGQAIRQVRSSSHRNKVVEPFSKTPAEKNRTAAAAAASQVKPSDAEGDAVWQDWRGYETSGSRSEATASRSTTRPQSSQNDDIDDWERGMSDDWNESTREQPRDRSASASPPRRDSFEQLQPPKQEPRSSSSSYGDRAPEAPRGGKSSGSKSSGGKTERVVDADFRVLVPPYRALEDEPTPTSSNSTSNPDSWFDDDEEEDARRSQR